MMSNKPGQSSVSGEWSAPHSKIRSVILLILLTFSVLLQGCFLDRLITLGSQTCSFDEYFAITLGRNVELEFRDPVAAIVAGQPESVLARQAQGSWHGKPLGVALPGNQELSVHHDHHARLANVDDDLMRLLVGKNAAFFGGFVGVSRFSVQPIEARELSIPPVQLGAEGTTSAYEADDERLFRGGG